MSQGIAHALHCMDTTAVALSAAAVRSNCPPPSKSKHLLHPPPTHKHPLPTTTPPPKKTRHTHLHLLPLSEADPAGQSAQQVLAALQTRVLGQLCEGRCVCFYYGGGGEAGKQQAGRETGRHASTHEKKSGEDSKVGVTHCSSPVDLKTSLLCSAHS